MSALVALFLLAAAVWFVANIARGPALGGREPIDSVSTFARAMQALDPDAAGSVPRLSQGPRPPQAAPPPARSSPPVRR